MIYLLGVVVVLFVLFTAYRDREARLERDAMARAHRQVTSELITRITHPEVVLVPEAGPVEKVIAAPDSEVETDEYGMVGTIVAGLPE
jgi:hypothetical protein